MATAAKIQDGNRASSCRRVLMFVERHPIWTVLVVAAVVRLFIAIVLTEFFSGTLVLDDMTYHAMAAQVAAGEITAWDDLTYGLYWSTAGFMVPVTALYKLFGPQPIVGQLFVGALGTASACFVTRLGLEFLAARWAVVAGLIVALLPSQAFWSSMLMKDAAVWFALSGLALTIALASRASGRVLFGWLLGVAGFLWMLSYLRLHTLVVASFAVMGAVLFGRKAQWLPRVASVIGLGIAIPWVFGAIGPAGLSLVTNAGSLEDRRFNNAVGAKSAIVDTSEVPPTSTLFPESPEVVAVREEAQDLESRAGQLEAQASALESVATRSRPAKDKRDELLAQAEALRSQAAAKLQATESPTPVGEAPLDPDLAHLPRGISVMLVEPFPVPYEGSVSLKLARLETVFWYPVLALALIGLWSVRPHLRVFAFPLLALGGILVMYALSEGNLGTAHRHRGEFVWAVALLAALGLSRLSARRSHHKSQAPESGTLPKVGLPI